VGTSTANKIRELSRRIVTLPVLNVNIEVRAYRGIDMLNAGLAPLIKHGSEELLTDEEADLIMKQAGEVLCACSVSPKIVPEGSELSGAETLSILDIPDDDIAYAFQQIIELSDSRFYGTNRTAYNPDTQRQLFEGQKRIALYIDTIAQRYGISPLEIERWTDSELGRVLAIIEVSEAEKRRQTDGSK